MSFHFFFRNTPTHVGKTINADGVGCDDEKHPHARGENESRSEGVYALVETPPRTWGKLGLEFDALARDRNTPTHVGKTNYDHC